MFFESIVKWFRKIWKKQKIKSIKGGPMYYGAYTLGYPLKDLPPFTEEEKKRVPIFFSDGDEVVMGDIDKDKPPKSPPGETNQPENNSSQEETNNH